jgi:hypothetical protein
LRGASRPGRVHEPDERNDRQSRDDNQQTSLPFANSFQHMRRRKLDMEKAFFNENSPGNNAASGDCASESQSRTKNEHAKSGTL